MAEFLEFFEALFDLIRAVLIALVHIVFWLGVLAVLSGVIFTVVLYMRWLVDIYV